MTSRRANAKFCSRRCFLTVGRAHVVWEPKPCDHCGNQYTPTGPKQRWCWDCLGEPTTYVNGTLNYPGQNWLILYDLSYPERMEMAARYDGKCWICQEATATAIDHDHKTGSVRGILCHLCNTILHEHVDAAWFTKAARYLEESKAPAF